MLGLEVAEEVVEAGEGAEGLAGHKVCALVTGGGYAEYCLAPAGTCLKVPEVFRMAEAAAMPETLFTVWVNLFERGFAADGDWVLVHGGTSGIGTMAIALGKLFGLRLIVTCGSDEKCARAIETGAEAAITIGPRISSRRSTAPRRPWSRRGHRHGRRRLCPMSCLTEEGRHVSIAVQRGPTAEIPIFDIMRRRLMLTGSTLRPRNLEFKTMVADEIARAVWPHAEGRLRPVIDSVFPLAEAAAAHARMESGEHVGKIVLSVAE